MHYTLNRNLRRNTKKYIHFNFNLYSNLCIVQCYEYVLSVAGIFRTTPQKIVKTLCWSPSCLVTACTTVAQPPPGKNLQSFFHFSPKTANSLWSLQSYLIIVILNHTDGITSLNMESKNHKFDRPPFCRIVLPTCIIIFYQPQYGQYTAL